MFHTRPFSYLCILHVRAGGPVTSGRLRAPGPAASEVIPGGLEGAGPWTAPTPLEGRERRLRVLLHVPCG